MKLTGVFTLYLESEKVGTEAKQLILKHLASYCEINSALSKLANRLIEETGTELINWVDHICFAGSDLLLKELEVCGFKKRGSGEGFSHLIYPGLPHVFVYDTDHFHLRGVAIRADSISDYLMVRGISSAIEGAPLGACRQVAVATEQGVALWIVERRGGFSLTPSIHRSGGPERVMRAREAYRSRPRVWEDGRAALQQAQKRVDMMIELVGKPLSADLFLEAERDYWQSRSAPAMLQRMKQDALGLGWANRRGHTFYSSFTLFKPLCALIESLGFEGDGKRYTHPDTYEGVRIVVNEQWCALHGDSILKAGLYSLSIPFIAEPERSQATWPIEKKHIDSLVKEGVISEEEAVSIGKEGAPGSCLEVI